MERPMRPDEDATAADIQAYFDAIEAWCEQQAAEEIRS